MLCPACGASGGISRIVLPDLVLRSCAECGLLTSEIDAPPSLGYAEIDDAAYDSALGTLRRQQVSDVIEFARSKAQDGMWLDIGCGPGYLLAEAARAGFSVRGVEPDPKAVLLARNRLGANAVRDGMFVAPEAEACDVISTLDVLEHVPAGDLQAFAEHIRRSLRSGGIWMIKLPSADGLYFKIAHAFRLGPAIARLWQVGYDSPHTVYFSRSTLERFLQRNGFEIVASRYMQEMPLRTAFARLTLDRTIARWKAFLALPAIAAVNAIESVRRKSDALLVMARPRAS